MKFRSLLVFTFLLFTLTLTVAQKSYEVNFRNMKYEPTENFSSFDPKGINESEIISGKFYRLVQFNDLLKNDDVIKIKSRGIELLSFIPKNTYLVSFPKDVSKSELLDMNIRSIWKVQSDLKMSIDVKSRSLPDWAIVDDNALLLVKYYKDLSQENVIDLLSQLKVEILEHNGINNYLTVSIPLERIAQLVETPFIQYIEPIQAPDVKDDRRGRSLHRVNRLDPNIAGARNYTGKGINVLVRDDGAVFEHIDFRGRLDQTFANPSTGSHGDGVAGILGGNGNLNPVNRGMAHESTIHVKNYTANFLDETMSLFNNKDVIVTNSSYSNGCNRGYTEITQIVDQQTFDNPTLMHVFSAGNNGQGGSDNDGNVFDCGYGAGLTWANITGGHKQGKNVIATANVNYRGEIMPSSSRGPAYDGRIKPDIAANGNNHVTTAETQDYRNFSGTSGAAPVVAGVMAMLHEAYETNHGTRANAALLKAIMLNTATDLGNKGPDFIYGWGSLNAHRAALCIEEGSFLNETIQQDEQKTHVIYVPDNVAELRVMVYWPDPEGFEQSPVSLLNDLNARLISADGSIELPWVLDPTPDPEKLDAPATKGIDFLNNMEQISIDNPVSGDYTLIIDGDLVPFGTNEYYVVWEYRMNEIDLIFPVGGENLNFNSSEVIHWDATGNEGMFTITHIDSDGNEEIIGQTMGSRRYYQWSTPNQFSEISRIRVSRDGLSAEGIAPFLLANNPRNLAVTFNDNKEADWLHWDTDTFPVSYNIYRLGDFIMEKVTTIEVDSFQIPKDAAYQNSFLAVSANFPGGTEGKRSIAISTTAQPTALATNNQNDKPCVLRPVVYETQSTDTLLRYNWQFGANALPESATTKGPHTVVYTKAGPNLALLSVENDGGIDNRYFSLTVQDDLDSKETELIYEGGGVYTFKSKILGANSYTWDFGDGNSGTGKTVTHTFEESGTYTITLEAENSCGVVIEVDEVIVNLTNINELKESDFVISPNPNHGDFTIILPDLEGNQIEIKLLSIDGRMVDSKRYNLTTPGQKVAWNGVASGIYVLKFNVGDKEISRKLIVN